MAGCATGPNVRRVPGNAGRVCPADYRIDPAAFSGACGHACDVLYVAGGLYGNPFALHALDRMLEAERARLRTAGRGDRVLCVFNGDAHWFDRTPEDFAAIERGMEGGVPLVGNVEAELRREGSVGAGCGCAYPDCTPDDAVSRSNRIHRILSQALDAAPELRARLAGRPATATVEVAGRRVAVTHGDERLVGGWGCSRESLMDVLRQDELDRWMRACAVDVLACTHTCAPAAIALGRGAVINNGAVGLPNFAGQRFGLATRIAPAGQEHPDALARGGVGGLAVELVPVRYDHDAFLTWFDERWNYTSPAAVSYRDRIVASPDDCLAAALLGGFAPGPAAGAEAGAGADEGALASTSPDRIPGAASPDRIPGAASPACPAPVATGVAFAPGTPLSSDARAAEGALARLVYFEDMLEDAVCRHTVAEPDTVQVNITARCNLACAHCHVGSDPERTEAMSDEVLDAVLAIVRAHHMQTIDITGGAPELHPRFAAFVRQAADAAPHVMVRTNLVILENPRYAPLIDEYARLGVEVVASVPSVFASQSEGQRGARTFDPSLGVLRRLNERGYGRDERLVLSLVFNPQHPVLPPDEDALEELYRRRLGEEGIAFTRVLAMANCPIGRYAESLARTGELDGYLGELVNCFNPATCEGLMCRRQLSVGWDGRVYDCDFNQALGLEARAGEEAGADLARTGEGQGADLARTAHRALTVFDYAADPARSLAREIAFGNHCYVCAAGRGSSCGGTLVQE